MEPTMGNAMGNAMESRLMASRLREVEERRGACFTEFYGLETPLDFGDEAREYRAVRDAVGILDLSWRRIVRFTGDDRASWLHGMTTSHVLDLKPGYIQPSTVCNNTGHLVGVMRILNIDDALWMDMHPACYDLTREFLETHLVMEDVEVAYLSPAWGTISAQGPRASELIETTLTGIPMAIPLASSTGISELPAAGRVVTIALGGERALLVSDTHTGEPGWDILAPTESLPSLWDALTEAATRLGGGPVGIKALQTLRVEAGIPWWGEDLDGSLLMLEAGLDKSIHHQKGCYIGQETLSRIHHRGHTNRRLAGVQILGDQLPASGSRLSAPTRLSAPNEGVAPGSTPQAASAPPVSPGPGAIRGGAAGEGAAAAGTEDTPFRDIGWITSAVFSPAVESPIALCFLRREYLEPGCRLRIEPGGEEAIVRRLPFVGTAG
jgi:folate-binding protein YgfZ